MNMNMNMNMNMKLFIYIKRCFCNLYKVPHIWIFPLIGVAEVIGEPTMAMALRHIILVSIIYTVFSIVGGFFVWGIYLEAKRQKDADDV